MKVYSTEEEQIERIKNWLREYGATIALAVVVVVAATIGLRYWQNSKENMLEQASSDYEQMVISMMAGQQQQTAAQASALIQEYPKSPYAKLAALTMAQQDVNNNDLAGAAIELKWVADNSGKSAIAEVAKIRLARVYTAMKNYQQALALLNQVDMKTFAPAVADARGDILAATGQRADARIAYQQALATAPNGDALVPLIQMKLADLASLNNKQQIAQR